MLIVVHYLFYLAYTFIVSIEFAPLNGSIMTLLSVGYQACLTVSFEVR